MKKRSGSIMLKTVIYISISMMLLVSAYSVAYKAVEVYRKNMCVSEMREIAEVVEDRIIYEIENSIDIKNIYTKSDSNSQNKYNGYTKISKIKYSMYSFNDLGECYIAYKNIKIRAGNIYIGMIGEYQIGNYVKDVYIKKKYSNGKTQICFIIVYKLEKYEHISRFSVYI